MYGKIVSLQGHQYYRVVYTEVVVTYIKSEKVTCEWTCELRFDRQEVVTDQAESPFFKFVCMCVLQGGHYCEAKAFHSSKRSIQFSGGKDEKQVFARSSKTSYSKFIAGDGPNPR